MKKSSDHPPGFSPNLGSHQNQVVSPRAEVPANEPKFDNTNIENLANFPGQTLKKDRCVGGQEQANKDASTFKNEKASKYFGTNRFSEFSHFDAKILENPEENLLERDHKSCALPTGIEA